MSILLPRGADYSDDHPHLIDRRRNQIVKNMQVWQIVVAMRCVLVHKQRGRAPPETRARGCVVRPLRPGCREHADGPPVLS